MMDNVKSFKGYGKVDENEQRAFRQKTRRRCIIIVVSVIVLTAVVIGAVVGTLANRKNGDDDKSTQSSSAESIKAVCSVTQYPNSCLTSLSSSVNGSTKLDPVQLIKLSIEVAVQELSKLSTVPDTLISRTTDALTKQALLNCKNLFEDSVDQLNASIASMDVGSVNLLFSATKVDDAKTWISTAITNQETCLDGLDETTQKEFLEEMKKVLQNSNEFTSNCLAIVTKITQVLKGLNIPSHRKLLALGSSSEQQSDFPSWMNSADRRLLQATDKPVPDITVAKDGTGNYRTIRDAVKAVKQKNKERTVIYVKEGKYVENVLVDKAHWNVMIYGDGMTKTIVSGRLNVIDGTPTFTTGTLIAAGKGFICMDMGIENTAGPEKHQAVAMRSGSDQSVFYRCAFNAFQDTLYAHSNRQFYRDCDIVGTVDFIFGNAAVVLQSCNIRPREPMKGQFITLTAQGKVDPNQNTGTSIQRSTIKQFNNVTAQIYLGRPWKNYSTTIIMETQIITTINPKGWAEWIQNVEPPSTIFYGEYKNTGPGSIVTGRVNWTGYQSAVPDKIAARYTVKSFILGGDWLPQTKVAFDPL